MSQDLPRLFAECIHCGFCLSACPTYQELGTEMDSPRGRIYLMRALYEGRIPATEDALQHIDGCLGCRACEPACPSGVQYGQILERSRAALEPQRTLSWDRRLIKKVLVEQVFPHPGRLQAAMLLGRLGSWMAPLLPPALRAALELAPTGVPLRLQLPAKIPAQGTRRYRVGLLEGCVASVLFAHVNEATVEVLTRHGCEVVVPRDQGCCGALHVHNGALDAARDFARRNVRAFDAAGLDAIITNAAGCGSTMKEYHHLLEGDERADRFRRKMRDVSEWLVEIGIIPPSHPVPLKVTYQDACHLAHAQRIRSQPRQVLAAIPELQLVEMAESDNCCGGAGVYNILQPNMSERLLARKVDAILETGARAVVASNPGCLMQIERGLRLRDKPLPCYHPIELLARSYRGDPTG